jgi:hypothetical protein
MYKKKANSGSWLKLYGLSETHYLVVDEDRLLAILIGEVAVVFAGFIAIDNGRVSEAPVWWLDTQNNGGPRPVCMVSTMFPPAI